jgi:hypothetical protein
VFSGLSHAATCSLFLPIHCRFQLSGDTLKNLPTLSSYCNCGNGVIPRFCGASCLAVHLKRFRPYPGLTDTEWGCAIDYRDHHFCFSSSAGRFGCDLDALERHRSRASCFSIHNHLTLSCPGTCCKRFTRIHLHVGP